MQFSTLKYFNEVVRTGSIRIAAERLNVAPSGISRQIRNLEEEFGVPLFERHSRGVILTSAGEAYARYAREAMLDQERIHSEIDELKGLRRGYVRIASVEGIVADGLTNAIASFRALFAGVTFTLEIIGTDDVVRTVENGDADIGITFTANLSVNVHCPFHVRDPLHVVASPRHPFAKQKRISLIETMSEPLAIPRKNFGIRTLLDTRCRSARISMRPALETNSIEALRGFARSNSGITFLTKLSVKRELEAGQLVAIPLSDRELQQANIEVCVLKDRTLPAATERFLNHLRRTLPQTR